MKDDKNFYYDRVAMLETDGWRDLVDELDNLFEMNNQIDSIESERDLWFAKGQLGILRQMLSLEDSTKQAMEELDL